MADDDIQSAEDPVAADNARKRLARQRRDDMDVLRLLMKTTKGRDWLYRYLESCHIMSSPFVPGESDTNTVMFRLGEQNAGKRLQVQVEGASVDLYMTMIKEQIEERAQLEAQRAVRAKEFDDVGRVAPGSPDDQYPQLSKPLPLPEEAKPAD